MYWKIFGNLPKGLKLNRAKFFHDRFVITYYFVKGFSPSPVKAGPIRYTLNRDCFPVPSDSKWISRKHRITVMATSLDSLQVRYLIFAMSLGIHDMDIEFTSVGFKQVVGNPIYTIKPLWPYRVLAQLCGDAPSDGPNAHNPHAVGLCDRTRVFPRTGYYCKSCISFKGSCTHRDGWFPYTVTVKDLFTQLLLLSGDLPAFCDALSNASLQIEMWEKFDVLPSSNPRIACQLVSSLCTHLHRALPTEENMIIYTWLRTTSNQLNWPVFPQHYDNRGMGGLWGNINKLSPPYQQLRSVFCAEPHLDPLISNDVTYNRFKWPFQFIPGRHFCDYSQGEDIIHYRFGYAHHEIKLYVKAGGVPYFLDSKAYFTNVSFPAPIEQVNIVYQSARQFAVPSFNGTIVLCSDGTSTQLYNGYFRLSYDITFSSTLECLTCNEVVLSHLHSPLPTVGITAIEVYEAHQCHQFNSKYGRFTYSVPPFHDEVINSATIHKIFLSNNGAPHRRACHDNKYAKSMRFNCVTCNGAPFDLKKRSSGSPHEDHLIESVFGKRFVYTSRIAEFSSDSHIRLLSFYGTKDMWTLEHPYIPTLRTVTFDQ